MGGVGVMFLEDNMGFLHVNMIRENGPAHVCGMIKQGDILLEIDGKEARFTASPSYPCLSGLHGSPVRLKLERGENVNGQVFEVELNRHSSCFPDVVARLPQGYFLSSQRKPELADAGAIPRK